MLTRSLAIVASLLIPTVLLAQPGRKVTRDVVFEASVVELQGAMTAGRLTSKQLVEAYLARIAAYDQAGPKLNAMVRINPNARTDASALDAERRAGRVRGPLHGIPVILKDNYGTAGMATSAGSIALADNLAGDAFQVRKLRDAGAVILGKSNMHELAAGITNIGSLGGQTCNPYDPDRNPGGSSGGSGAAAAASFAAFTMGSDTCGSIRIPAAVHNLFGLRPTKGLSSIDGIVPLSHTQDVGGPIARTVMDLAIALDATVGADPNDPATKLLAGRPLPKFVAGLDSTSLKGARFAVLTSQFGEESDDAEGARVVRASLDKLRARGAEVINVVIPKLDSIVARASVIDYEFKYDLIDYLAKSPSAVKSLNEIITGGLHDIALEQAFRRRDTTGSRDSDAYRAALARRDIARDMVVAFLDSAKFDALVYPTMRRKAARIGEPQRGANCTLSAVTGLPALSMPAGFTPDGLPMGVELLGRPHSDARLLSFAYDYERSAHPRRAPATTPGLVNGRAPVPRVYTSSTKGVSGRFSFDATQRSLAYSIVVRGVSPSRVVAVSLVRDSAGRRGAVIRRLAVSGSERAAGSFLLAESERRDLLAGNLWLVLFTTDTKHPVAAPLRASNRGSS